MVQISYKNLTIDTILKCSLIYYIFQRIFVSIVHYAPDVKSPSSSSSRDPSALFRF